MFAKSLSQFAKFVFIIYAVYFAGYVHGKIFQFKYDIVHFPAWSIMHISSSIVSWIPDLFQGGKGYVWNVYQLWLLSLIDK